MSRSGNKVPGLVDERIVAVGHHLQSIRKKRGLTQKRLAEKIGVSREAIASYEAGRSHLTDLVLMDLADALRVSADEILGLRPPADAVPVSRRLMKRMVIIESLPEGVKKRVLRTLDDSIKANTHLSILDD